MDLIAQISFDGGVLLGINVLLWLLSLSIGKVWPVDFIWSSWPIVQAVMIYLRQEQGDCSRQIAVFALVCVWGFRLTMNFVRRGGVGHEDWRYTDMRTKFGTHFWWASLFTVFIGQTVFMFAPCLALYGALLADQPFGPLDTAASFLCVAAVLLEAAADMQMDAFQALKREKKTEAPLIDSGLWMWSRHPNYLGEILWWWGLWLFSAGSLAPTWVVVGPCSITFLFVFVSVGLMEDRQLKSKGEAFVEYKRQVPSPLLLLPPPLNRRVGAWLYGASDMEGTSPHGNRKVQQSESREMTGN